MRHYLKSRSRHASFDFYPVPYGISPRRQPVCLRHRRCNASRELEFSAGATISPELRMCRARDCASSPVHSRTTAPVASLPRRSKGAASELLRRCGSTVLVFHLLPHIAYIILLKRLPSPPVPTPLRRSARRRHNDKIIFSQACWKFASYMGTLRTCLQTVFA